MDVFQDCDESIYDSASVSSQYSDLTQNSQQHDVSNESSSSSDEESSKNVSRKLRYTQDGDVIMRDTNEPDGTTVGGI